MLDHFRLHMVGTWRVYGDHRTGNHIFVYLLIWKIALCMEDGGECH